MSQAQKKPETQKNGQGQKTGQVVAVDESAAQPGAGVDIGPTPDGFAMEVPKSIQHFEKGHPHKKPHQALKLLAGVDEIRQEKKQHQRRPDFQVLQQRGIRVQRQRQIRRQAGPCAESTYCHRFRGQPADRPLGPG